MSIDLSGGGSSDWLSGSASPSASPLTLAAWFNADGFTGADEVIALTDSSVTNRYIGIRLSSSNCGAHVDSASGFAESLMGSGGSGLGSWTHVGGVFASTTSRLVYVNGSPGTENTGTSSTVTIDTLGIGGLIHSSPTNTVNGKIAEVAVWTAGLSAAEMAALANGVSPLLIRPGSLYAYLPLLDKASPSIDLIGANGSTWSDTPASFQDHPPIIRPSAQILQFPPVAAAPPSGAIMNQLQGANMGADLFNGTLL